MKSKLLILIFVFINNILYSQNIPDWLKMGMTKSEIENYLNGQYLSHKNDDLYISVNTQNFIIYQYNIDKINGLNQYWVIGLYFDIKKILDNFSMFYGDPIINNNQYWWYNSHTDLPVDVLAICITASGDAVNITYFFSNFFQ